MHQLREYSVDAAGLSGKGSVHLCEQTGCKIPSENFWIKN